MGGETEASISGWTVDTLHALVTIRFDAINTLLDERQIASEKASDLAAVVQQTAMRTALDAAKEAVTAALTSAKDAVIKAEMAADKRFENMNEFRQHLADQAATFMPRTEVALMIKALEDKIQDRSDDKKTDIWRFITVIVSVLAIGVAIYAGVKP